MSENRKEVLDHGYVELVETWGSDERIIEAARMSTSKGFKGWGPITECKKCGLAESLAHPGAPHEYMTVEQFHCKGHEMNTRSGDEKLLRYLYEHKHSTPFEMAGLVIEVQAPIFVFRQWHRHRTQSYNELSARYTPLPAVDYIPTVERLLSDGGKNKQAGTVKGAEDLDAVTAAAVRVTMESLYNEAERKYQEYLKLGVPKELARAVLPVARYSCMRASANLRNWLAFLTLRMDSHAQYEIRVYAEAVGEFIAQHFPRTWELFAENK